MWDNNFDDNVSGDVGNVTRRPPVTRITRRRAVVARFAGIVLAIGMLGGCGKSSSPAKRPIAAAAPRPGAAWQATNAPTPGGHPALHIPHRFHLRLASGQVRHRHSGPR